MMKRMFLDVESLFPNIPIKDTIEYITEQIYTHKKLKKTIFSKQIFKRLLLKLATECTYTLSFVNRLMVAPWEVRCQ